MTTHTTPLILTPPADLLEQHPDLRHAVHELSQQYVYHNALVTDEQLQAIGTRLWACLAADAALHTARQQAGTLVLPLIVHTATPALQVLPWECLYHPDYGFLGRDPRFALSRCVPMASPPALPPLHTGPLRVLLFTSLPEDLDAERGRLDVEAEQAQVLEALDPWLREGQVVLEVPDTGDFAVFKRLLQTGHYALVFLSGHGAFQHEPHSEAPPYAIFQFEDAAGRRCVVRDTELAQAFVGAGVQCVVLSACESGKTAASGELQAGLAQRLLGQGVPHVVGMRESVLDRAGILFARAFCDAIARQQRVDVAVQQGRAAITQPLRDATWRDGDKQPLDGLSLGQWTLPQLLSHDITRGLIGWDFTPVPPQAQRSEVLAIANIPEPPLYIGRRLERHRLWQAWPQQPQLLITGPGGQGKTALLVHLAQRLAAQGYVLYAFSARDAGAWEEFMFSIQMALSAESVQEYDSKLSRCETPLQKAQLLLTVLRKQHDNVLMVLDNLETVQDAERHALVDEAIAAWVAACQKLCVPLLVTSRWALPEWTGQHHALQRPSYGDFLRYVRQLDLRTSRAQLREVYRVLGGNFRGLEFFAKASAQLSDDAQQAFLARLATAQQELQTDMAIAFLYAHLPAEAQRVLVRLSAYTSAVGLDGVRKVCGALTREAVEAALQALLAVSLVDGAPFKDRWRYQCAAQVGEWLRGQGLQPELAVYALAAEYQQYWFEAQEDTVEQAVVVHQALQLAEAFEAAREFVLNYLAEYFMRVGLYRSFIEEWLPDLLRAEGVELRGRVFSWAGFAYKNLGDYATALDYYQRALAIKQEIGDKSGEGATLNNISQIYDARGDYATALDYLQRSLAITQEIGDKSGEGTTLGNIANNYYALGNVENALDYMQRSLLIFQEIGDKAKEKEGTTLNNISQIFKARGDSATALDYLQRALAIQQEIGDKSGEGTTLNNISLIFKARGDSATALDYLQRALAIRQEIGDKSGEGTTLNNISQIYDARGDSATALDYLQRCLTIFQEIGDKAHEGGTLNNISQIYDARGDSATALDYLQRALAIQQEIGDVAGMCPTLFNMGRIYLEKEEIEEAIIAFATVYQLAQPMQLAEVLQHLDDLAKQLGGSGLDDWARLAAQLEERAGEG